MGSQQRRRRRGRQQSALGRVIDRAKQGDSEAIGVLYRNHVGMVYGYLRACGAPEADDLTADVFVGVLRNIHAFDGGPNEFRAWLMTIAYRRMIDARRRRASRDVDLREPQVFEAVESLVSLELPAVEIDPQLTEALSRLTDAQREVLALRFVADLGLERVAAITGRPVGAVKSLQHRALASLRAVLSNPLGDDGEVATR